MSNEQILARQMGINDGIGTQVVNSLIAKKSNSPRSAIFDILREAASAHMQMLDRNPQRVIGPEQ